MVCAHGDTAVKSIASRRRAGGWVYGEKRSLIWIGREKKTETRNPQNCRDLRNE